MEEYIKILGLTIGLFLFFLSNSYAQQFDSEVFVQLGHNTNTATIDISPDGKYLLSGVDGVIKYWEIETGRLIRTMSSGRDVLTQTVVFTPNGRYALADGGAWFNAWDLLDGKRVNTFSDGHDDSIQEIELSPNGRYAFVGSDDGTNKIWDLTNGDSKFIMENLGSINSFSFSNEGKIAVGLRNFNDVSNNNGLVIWDLTTDEEKIRFYGHTDEITSVDSSPDRKFLVSGSIDRSVKLWDANSGNELKTFSGFDSPVGSVEYSPDGNKIAAYDWNGDLRIWDISTGSLVQNLSIDGGRYSNNSDHAKFLPDGDKIAVISTNGIPTIIEIETGNILQTFESEISDGISDLQTERQNNYVYVATNNHSIKKIDLTNGQTNTLFRGGETNTNLRLDICEESNFLISGSGNFNSTGKVIVWDLTNDNQILSFDSNSKDIACSPDGQFIASIDYDGNITIWDTNKGTIQKTIHGDEESVYRESEGIDFSSDGNVLTSVSGEQNRKLKFWNIYTGELIKEVDNKTSNSDQYAKTINSLKFSSKGDFILTGSGDLMGEIIVWDAKTVQRLKVLEGHFNRRVTSIDISNDSKYAVSGAGDAMVKVWDLRTGEEVASLNAHDLPVESVSFSNNDKYIISGSFDGSIIIWDLLNKTEVARIYSFDNEEWVTITPEGYYDASENGGKLLNMRIGNSVYSMDNFFDTYYRPDIVRAKLAGEDISPLIDSDIRNVSERPPIVSFSSPQTNSSTNEQSITLTAEITGSGSGIGEIRLMHNGSNISGDLRGFRMVLGQGQSIARTFEVSLLPGENRFTLTAFNDTRIESNPAELTVSYVGAARASDLHIIAIGIDEYQNSRYNLNYGRSDAEAFASMFEKNGERIFRSINVTRIFNEDATKQNIQAAFDRVQQTADPEDTFMFFYAGHGVVNEPEDPSERPDFYMALHDVTQLYGQTELLKERGISATEMTNMVSDVEALKKLVVFDACQAGGAIDAFAFRGAAEERAIQQLARSAGVAIIASAESEQFATEFSQLGHGVFTYALIEGLTGSGIMDNRSSSITVQQLVAYLNQAVPDLTQQYRGQTQYPVSFSRGQDFPLMIRN